MPNPRPPPAEWLEGSGRPAAWLSLDPGDSDLSVFLRHVLSAIKAMKTWKAPEAEKL